MTTPTRSRPDGGGPPDDDQDRTVRSMAGLGIQFAGAVVLCVLLGNWADKRFGTGPWGVLAGAAVGFGAGLFTLVRAGRRAEQGQRGKGDGQRAKGNGGGGTE